MSVNHLISLIALISCNAPTFTRCEDLMSEPADLLQPIPANQAPAPTASAFALAALDRILAAAQAKGNAGTIAAEARALAEATTSAAERMRRQLAALEGVLATADPRGTPPAS
jgi:hypothetical protein